MTAFASTALTLSKKLAGYSLVAWHEKSAQEENPIRYTLCLVAASPPSGILPARHRPRAAFCCVLMEWQGCGRSCPSAPAHGVDKVCELIADQALSVPLEYRIFHSELVQNSNSFALLLEASFFIPNNCEM